MSSLNGIVYLLDDEPGMVKALMRLLRCNDFEVKGFTSPAGFLEAWQPSSPGCLVLDVAMPELDGLNFQKQLRQRGLHLPIVFLTGHGDIPMTVRALKAGAIDFLTKPVKEEDLLRAVRLGLAKAQEQKDLTALGGRLALLTAREREVMEHVVAGKLNKQIAVDLGTGEQNIKFHRAHVMKKMGVESLADLVRLAEKLGIGNS